ncbi:MAG: LamG domain-containing protein, partial [Candidatus Aenigmarchaeota archaeon]|nr:LamG domain-containing protein [Candidatus Aenigmarchaeota archaeon]
MSNGNKKEKCGFNQIQKNNTRQTDDPTRLIKYSKQNYKNISMDKAGLAKSKDASSMRQVVSGQTRLAYDRMTSRESREFKNSQSEVPTPGVYNHKSENHINSVIIILMFIAIILAAAFLPVAGFALGSTYKTGDIIELNGKSYILYKVNETAIVTGSIHPAGIFVPSYSCSDESLIKNEVLTPKKHTLRFDFSDGTMLITGYAYNDAEAPRLANLTFTNAYITSTSGIDVTGNYDDFVYGNDTLTCMNNTLTDANLAGVNYRWYVNDALVQDESTNKLLPTMFSDGDLIRCDAVPKDSGTEYNNDTNTLLLCHFNNLSDTSNAFECINSTNNKINATSSASLINIQGKFNNATQISSGANLTYSNTYYNSSVGTIDFWFQPRWASTNIVAPNGTDNYIFLFSMEDITGGGGNVRVRYFDNDYATYPNRYLFEVFDTSTWEAVASTPQTFSASDWIHLAFSYQDTSGAKIYINNVIINSTTNTFSQSTPTTPLFIGSNSSSTSDHQCNCSIDELRISNIQRTVFSTAANGTIASSLNRTIIHNALADFAGGWNNGTGYNASGNLYKLWGEIGGGSNTSTGNLVGLWHFNNDTTDYSGLSHTTTSGNVSGLGKANCSTAVNGKFGTACSFGTTDADIINISMGSSLLNNSGSLEMWLKPSVAGSDNNEYIYFSSPHAIPDASRGLVGLWHLDNSTQDSSGLGNHGTSVGGTNCSTTVSGKFGTACSFGTTDADIINISMGSSLLNNSGSLEMWLKPSVAGNDNNEYIYFSSPHAIPDASR